jgi:hypothetical protein
MEPRTKAILSKLRAHLASPNRTREAPDIMGALAQIQRELFTAYAEHAAKSYTGGRYWYTQRLTSCGKPFCKCAHKGPIHGPYWYAVDKRTGRQKYIGRRFYRLPDDRGTLAPPCPVACPLCGNPAQKP